MEPQGAKRYLLMGLGRGGGGRRRFVDGEQWRSAVDSEAAAEALVGGGVPVGIGRGGGVGELREVEAQLMEGSAWVERLRRGGLTAASSSPAFEQSGGGVLGSGVVELAKGRGEWIAGYL